VTRVYVDMLLYKPPLYPLWGMGALALPVSGTRKTKGQPIDGWPLFPQAYWEGIEERS